MRVHIMRNMIIVSEDEPDLTGYYILFTYIGLPFRSLKIGAIDDKRAHDIAIQALEKSTIKYKNTDQGDEVSNIISDLAGNISSFLDPLDSVTLRSLNRRSLRSVNYRIKEALNTPAIWKHKELTFGNIVYNVDCQFKDKVPHGLLWIKASNKIEAHLYVLFEGRGLAYIQYNNYGILKQYDLDVLDPSLYSTIPFGYDRHTNMIWVGNKIKQFNPYKAPGYKVTFPGFDMIYNQLIEGYPTASFKDMTGKLRNVTLIPHSDWYKYTNLGDDDRYLPLLSHIDLLL